MESDLTDEGDQERERERLRDGKAGREGFGLTAIANHDGTETPSSFHPCPSMDYAQFSIRGVVEVYSIHLNIDCSGTFIDGIYSTDGALSSQIFYDPTCMAHVWNRLHQRRYDLFDHERARDVRLKKIGELYWNYKVKLHKGWLEHR
ncbi:hypothetical protein COCNU_scaffold004286G000010 [Cocos nucifera]|nr:hypothetical protein [Cocos nucifera]